MATESTSLGGWKQLYQSALLETDPAKVLVRVADARAAICDRLRELLPLPSCEEHLTLKGALRFLDILEKEMLEARDAA